MAGKTAAEFLRSFERSGFMVDVTPTLAAPGVHAGFKALFQDEHSEIRFGMVSASEPAITFEQAYCPLLTNGDTVSIGGADYKVRDGGNFKDATARRFRVRKVTP